MSEEKTAITTDDFLREHLNVDNYDNLSRLLDITGNKKTRILREPVHQFPAIHIIKISRLTGIHAYRLVMKHNLGADYVSVTLLNDWCRDYQLNNATLVDKKAA